jgi:hypothetical protein
MKTANRTDRRNLRRSARYKVTKSKHFVLFYLNSEGKLNCELDIPDPAGKLTITEQALGSMAAEGISICSFVNTGMNKEKNKSAEEIRVLEIKERRSEELKAFGDSEEQLVSAHDVEEPGESLPAV